MASAECFCSNNRKRLAEWYRENLGVAQALRKISFAISSPEPWLNPDYRA